MINSLVGPSITLKLASLWRPTEPIALTSTTSMLGAGRSQSLLKKRRKTIAKQGHPRPIGDASHRASVAEPVLSGPLCQPALLKLYPSIT